VAVNTSLFNEAEPSVGWSYGRVVELVRDFALERAGGRWAESCEKHLETLRGTLRVLEEMREMKWWLGKSLLLLVRATKRVFLAAEARAGSSGAAARLRNSLFNTLQTFKAAKALEEEIRREFLSLVDVMQVSLLLASHNYQQVQRLLYSARNYGELSTRCQDNFLFQKGKYALVNENLL
jgi:hypothetical protein